MHRLLELVFTYKSRISPRCCNYSKGPATRNDIVNDIIDDLRADALFATLKKPSSTIQIQLKRDILRVTRKSDLTEDHERQPKIGNLNSSCRVH